VFPVISKKRERLAGKEGDAKKLRTERGDPTLRWTSLWTACVRPGFHEFGGDTPVRLHSLASSNGKRRKMSSSLVTRPEERDLRELALVEGGGCSREPGNEGRPRRAKRGFSNVGIIRWGANSSL